MWKTLRPRDGEMRRSLLTPEPRAVAIHVPFMSDDSSPTRARGDTERTRLPSDHPQLVEALGLLDVVARGIGRQLGSRFELDDLKGYAHEAIADLVERFDASRGVTFRAYARVRLRGAIIDGIRRESGLPRGVAARLRALEAADLYVDAKSEENGREGRAQLASAEAADQRMGNFLRGIATAYATGLIAGEPPGDTEDGAAERTVSEQEDPEEEAGRNEARALIEHALESIGDPEGTILRRHYFLDEDLQDAAAHLGLSKSWGSRLHARGIEKLAVKLREMRGAL
jgi:RNA polymerase sigma factor FliA